MAGTYTERGQSPEGEFNHCYMTNLYGAPWDTAWNTCIYGSPSLEGANVLSNCTGYAQGRALEIYNEVTGTEPQGTHPFVALNGDAGTCYATAQAVGLELSTTPTNGAIMVWTEAGEAGHVAVVERVIDENTVIATESAWGGFSVAHPDPYWMRHNRYRGNGDWSGDAFTMEGYQFLGFIVNPADPDTPYPPTPPEPEGSTKRKGIFYIKPIQRRNNYKFYRL